MSLIIGLLSGLKDLLNVFLDTTPRQWIHSLLDLVAGLRQQVRGVFGAALTASVLGHGVLLVSNDITAAVKSAISAKQDGETIDLKERAELEQMLEQKQAMEVVGVYYLNGTEKIKKSLVSPDFLRLFKNMKQLNAVSRWSLKEASATTTPPKPGAADGKMDWSKATQEMRAKDSIQPKQPNREQSLIKTLHSYNPQFQACYERSLLKDPTISGKIAFELMVGTSRRIAQSNIKFEGQASAAGLDQLTDCLEAVTSKVMLPPEAEGMSGKRIKFYVMLKSS